MSRVVIVGSGGEPYRRYAMQSVTEEHSVAMVLTGEPTWQRDYSRQIAVIPPRSPSAMAAAIAELTLGIEDAGSPPGTNS